MKLSSFRRIRALVALLPILLAGTRDTGAQEGMSPHVGETFWRIDERQAIIWDVANERRLPHADHIEMAGRRVAAIVDYRVNEEGVLEVRREVIYPQLRVFPRQDSPEVFPYRAYLRQNYSDAELPVVLVDQVRLVPQHLEQVRIDGVLRFRHQVEAGMQIERCLYPSMSERLFVEQWTVKNASNARRTVEILPATIERRQQGPEGAYRVRLRTVGAGRARELAPGELLEFAVYFEALAGEESPVSARSQEVLAERRGFVTTVTAQTALRSPDPAIDTLFAFAKIRAAENIFESKLGLIHSPGGGNYYAGVWANDQAEYSGPFFPYLGYEPGEAAALNAYVAFLERLPKDGGKTYSSYEMQGELPCCSKDRGDAAMLAYGAAQYALATGDPGVGRLLWPLIEWGLEYSHRQLNNAGVVRSQSDEMEGRLPTGSANLSTSSLYYGALRQAALLATALGHERPRVQALQQRAEHLAAAIEEHFGAEIGGLRTYRYFEGHDAWRHWISLPLVVGLHSRAPGTLEALFERMWSIHGVRVEASPGEPPLDLFWDRGTLYALRAAFLAGAADVGLKRLQEYSRTCLLGFHVPYPIEAWPEHNMRHLSAESALYGRVIIEGLLGIMPTRFDTFTLRPRLPAAWAGQGYELLDVSIIGGKWSIAVGPRIDGGYRVRVREGDQVAYDELIVEGAAIEIRRR